MSSIDWIVEESLPAAKPSIIEGVEKRSLVSEVLESPNANGVEKFIAGNDGRGPSTPDNKFGGITSYEGKDWDCEY